MGSEISFCKENIAAHGTFNGQKYVGRFGGYNVHNVCIICINIFIFNTRGKKRYKEEPQYRVNIIVKIR